MLGYPQGVDNLTENWVRDVTLSPYHPPCNRPRNSNLIDTGGLFNLAKEMVLVHHKELEYKVEKRQYKKVEVMPPKINNKSRCPVRAGAWYTKWIARLELRHK